MRMKRFGIILFSVMAAVGVAGIILAIKNGVWWDVVGYAAAGCVMSGLAFLMYKNMILTKLSFSLLMVGIILGALLIAKYLIYGEYGDIFWMSVLMLMGTFYIVYSEKEEGLKWD